MKVVSKLAIATFALGGVLLSSNALAARNNAPLTGQGSTMQPQNRYVQPAPRYTPPSRQYFAPPKFVPRARPPCNRTTGAGSTSNCT